MESYSTQQRLIYSYAILEVMQFLDKKELYRIQILEKYFYDKLIPNCIKEMKSWNQQACYIAFEKSQFFYFLDRNTLKWDQKKVNLVTKKGKIQTSFRFDEMWAKVLQIQDEIYFIGGNLYFHYSSKQCYRLNLKNQMMHEITSLSKQRYGHGLCHLGQYIYATGGVDNYSIYLDHCERYDLLNNTWEDIPKFDCPIFSHSLISVRKRYLYSFGGMYEKPEAYKYQERLMRLDTHKIGRVECNWEYFAFPSEFQQGCQYQVYQMPQLSQNGQIQEYIIFGGVGLQNNVLNRVSIFSENLKVIQDSKFSSSSEKLKIIDRFYYNQAISLDRNVVLEEYENELKKNDIKTQDIGHQLIGAMGRFAFHVIDLDNQKIIIGDKSKGYVNHLSQRQDDNDDEEDFIEYYD
ncbi:kelch motif family protein [Stylonychia lemnae]|uniref:Kelch motif family protein n=1 Tax=Stylonychia lemnae TaxID=5949 RepID=A0A078APU1_STYLE|nr:kelch motif family protein [Stylonychia lemnae]|eukprot:CDW83317.1 kelch motif family protein [Stylonychia lemnae]